MPQSTCLTGTSLSNTFTLGELNEVAPGLIFSDARRAVLAAMSAPPLFREVFLVGVAERGTDTGNCIECQRLAQQTLERKAANILYQRRLRAAEVKAGSRRAASILLN